MTLAPEHQSLGIVRHLTSVGVHPFDEVEWARRDARLMNYVDGSVAFEQTGVEFPTSWSDNAVNIVTQKYFRGTLGTVERETSLRQVIGRVVDTLTAWGLEGGYFSDEAEGETFSAELSHLLVHQMAAFNSPVWFNIGVDDVVPQASACFILGVDDTMASILNWYAEEGMIFKGGSGAGVNLSKIRSSREPLRGGGTASGPVSFMRGADASAGTIKSGGKTRRAAKMVVLDADHPDIEQFIWCKAREEQKALALRAAGFDMGLDGDDAFSIQYQNANNSVRVTDEFMEAVEADDDWQLTSRGTGETLETVRAGDLFRQIAEASWACADPGIQFDSTINGWHTAPNAGRITASNPCSEYFHLDNSACNLASLNLLSFLDTDNSFDVDGFRAAVDVVITAQEILVSNSHYPTPKITHTTEDFRQLGLGYSNLGALLMALGLPYDSDAGRAVAGSITALMTGEAYAASARMAGRLGPFNGFESNRDAMLGVLRMHQQAVAELDEDLAEPTVLEAAQRAWDEACTAAELNGVRNSQATVLAPTGTISFMMDCDTTGIEPDLGLVKTKTLVGGGTMSIVNQTVRRALGRLGYDLDQIDDIVAYVDENHSVLGAPHLAADHVPVFACSMGDNVIHHLGHVRMIAAVQPFLSGGVSKTVNVPESTTVDDIADLYLDAWRLGVKAVAIYRDGSKLGQPLSVGNGDEETSPPVVADIITSHGEPVRRRLPRDRHSRTFEFRVADCKGFVTVGEYDDGRPGEIFVRVSKQGSTLAGIMDAFAISISHGLQYGVPLRAFVDAFVGMRFEPQGMTDDPDLRISSSLIDYLFRKLAVMYLSPAERSELNIFTTGERLQPTLPGVEEQVTENVQGPDVPPDPPTSHHQPVLELGARTNRDAPFCMQCGTQMVRAGACHVCTNCGTTSGCS
ncbi:MAG: vitamin B12-dependent ribonucleotide reductase [Acidimicrobiia bacterium]|nr:vitamin B12-dependent ribonucleotide reductase [Acidimicrobiia bacterium]